MTTAMQSMALKLVPVGSENRPERIRTLIAETAAVIKNEPIAGFEPAIETIAVQRALITMEVALAALSIDGLSANDGGGTG